VNDYGEVGRWNTWCYL